LQISWSRLSVLGRVTAAIFLEAILGSASLWAASIFVRVKIKQAIKVPAAPSAPI